MAKKDITKYEISELRPLWIDQNFPTDKEYEAVRDVVRFYLINTPCPESSSRGTDMTVWGDPKIVLLDRMKELAGFENRKNFDYAESSPAVKKLFEKYQLGNGFETRIENIAVFLRTEDVANSLFRHLRNAIAHSR